jgi:hypothetical protein
MNTSVLPRAFMAASLGLLLSAHTHAQCTTGNANCVGTDCESTTTKSVEYAEGFSSGSSTTTSDVFGTFKEDVSADGYINGNVSMNTNAAFIRKGAASMKHSIWGPDNLDSNGKVETGKRAEITDVALQVHPLKDTAGNPYYYWYGWSYYIPNDANWTTPVDPKVPGAPFEQYIGQLRFPNGNGCVTMINCNASNIGGSGHHLRYVGGKLIMTLTIQDTVCGNTNPRLRQVEFDLGNAVKGQWMDFMIQAKWSGTASGTFKLWLQKNNGGYTQLVDYTGPNWISSFNNNATCPYRVAEVLAPNFQVGLYASNDHPLVTNPRVLYSDEPAINRTLCPDTTTSEAWTKTLPAAGAVNSPALVANENINVVELDKLTQGDARSFFTSSTNTARETGGTLLTDKTDEESSAIVSANAQARLVGLAVGSFTSAPIYLPSAGTYNVTLQGLTGVNRAAADLYVNNVKVSGWDQYSTTSPDFVGFKNYGTLSLNQGLNTFKWVITGKSGSPYTYNGVTKWFFSMDKLELTSTTGRTPTETEMEGKSYTVTVGDSVSTFADATYASGGSAVKFTASAINDFAQTGVTAPTAGNYNVKLRCKRFTSRGNAALYVNNVLIGGFDQYSTTANDWFVKDYGTVALVAGTNTFKWVITGKAAGATSYDYTFDKITLTPQ